MAIADEISSYINHPVEKIADRQEAIKAAMAITNHELDAVIIAGKGADCYQIVQGKKEAYPGDAAVAENYYKIVKIKGCISLDFFYLYLKAFFKPSTAPSTVPLASSTTSLP